MDFWKTQDTPGGMQSLESMGEIREILGDSYYGPEKVDPEIAELLEDI